MITTTMNLSQPDGGTMRVDFSICNLQQPLTISIGRAGSHCDRTTRIDHPSVDISREETSAAAAAAAEEVRIDEQPEPTRQCEQRPRSRSERQSAANQQSQQLAEIGLSLRQIADSFAAHRRRSRPTPDTWTVQRLLLELFARCLSGKSI